MLVRELNISEISNATISFGNDTGQLYYDAEEGNMYLNTDSGRVVLAGITPSYDGTFDGSFEINLTTDTTAVTGRHGNRLFTNSNTTAWTNAPTGQYAYDGISFTLDSPIPEYEEELTDSPELDDFLDSFMRN
jgi:hypothetical protein